MKKLSLFLVTLVLAVALIGCKTTTTTTATTTTTTTATTTTTLTPITEDRVINDDYTLLLQSSTMDGVFNPFFYSSAYDGQVAGLVNVGLLTTDESGAVVASDYYPTVADSYSIYYTDNLTTYAPKADYEEGDYVVYDIVLKNGAKFSDGTAITADDVLFNMYTYLDPSYNGSSTLYTLPILGLTDFRTQVPNAAQYAPLAAQILADDGRVDGYVATAAYTEAQFDAYWAAFEVAGEQFAQEIVNYVMSNYSTDSFVARYFGGNYLVENAEGLYVKTSATGIATYSATNPDHVGLTRYNCTLTFADVQASAGLRVAYGMAMWGFWGGVGRAYSLSADGLTWSGATADYSVATLTVADYFQDILDAYADVDGVVDYANVSSIESAGSDFVANATENFTKAFQTVGSVPSVAGLVKGTKTIDSVVHETVKIVLTEQNPKAILSLGVTVTPAHYYTAGYTYPVDAIKNFGVEFDNPLFMAHLATFNGAPMGGGTYIFDHVDSGDGTVYFTRNEYFETMGGVNVYNSNINKVALKIVSSGYEYSALEAGDVAYATVSATSDVMDSVALSDNLVAVLVDNLGYGYICVNPQVYDNLYERIALTTVFDMSKVLNYYPNGLADLITRAQSQVSWAYPEGAEYIYPFDATMASAISYLELAGYTYDAVAGEFTDTPTYTFTLPSDVSAHPAGGVYLEAQRLLATIGVTAEIVTDASLIAHIKTAPVGVYALAWQSAQDPDMYQVYHYLSQADSVTANGIAWLYENGDDDALGTIEVVKLDGVTETMNQKEALEYLGYLIEQGTKYMLTEERAPIYAKALEVLAQLNIEVPTYQRKNLFVYDGSIIDQATLSTTVTPYWGPMAEIWKVSFASGVEGNTTETVVVGYVQP